MGDVLYAVANQGQANNEMDKSCEVAVSYIFKVELRPTFLPRAKIVYNIDR